MCLWLSDKDFEKNFKDTKANATATTSCEGSPVRNIETEEREKHESPHKRQKTCERAPDDEVEKLKKVKVQKVQL